MSALSYKVLHSGLPGLLALLRDFATANPINLPPMMTGQQLNHFDYEPLVWQSVPFYSIRGITVWKNFIYIPVGSSCIVITDLRWKFIQQIRFEENFLKISMMSIDRDDVSKVHAHIRSDDRSINFLATFAPDGLTIDKFTPAHSTSYLTIGVSGLVAHGSKRYYNSKGDFYNCSSGEVSLTERKSNTVLKLGKFDFIEQGSEIYVDQEDRLVVYNRHGVCIIDPANPVNPTVTISTMISTPARTVDPLNKALRVTFSRIDPELIGSIDPSVQKIVDNGLVLMLE